MPERDGVGEPPGCGDHQDAGLEGVADELLAVVGLEALLRQLVRDAEAHTEEDKKKKELIEARNQADALVHSTEKALSEHGDKVSPDEKTAIEAGLAALKEAVKGDDVEAIKEKTNALAQSSMKLGEAMYKAQQSEAAASDAAADGAGTKLRIGWGIGASAADFAEFKSRHGLEMRSGYGSTEGNVGVYMPHDDPNLSSVGRALPGFEVRIADETNDPLPPGKTGEILVRATEPCTVMLGYDGDPAATLAAWKDLWFHTGDAGYLDTDGNLFFKGRVKDGIRVRGENVSAFEVEEAIAQVDGVLEVAAIAVPCELGGDDVKIAVVTSAGCKLDAQTLIAHAEKQLPKFAVPRYVEFVAALPKTETNKVRKNVLRETPFTPATWDRLKLHHPNNKEHHV